MSWEHFLSFGPLMILQGLLSLPLFSLVLAAIVTVAIRVRRAWPARSESPRYAGEIRALGLVAIGVILAFAVENILRGYVLNMTNVVEWWRFATPVFAAALGLAIVLALVIRATRPPDEPILSTARRTWLSFGSRASHVTVIVSALLLTGTTIAAGLASSSDEDGRFIYLEIYAPNTDIGPLRPWFYGWAYGVPVLICLALLVVVGWLLLRNNAARPFERPSTVALEQVARTEVASSAVRIATAGILLALGGALRYIAANGTFSQVTVQGDDGDATYQLVWRYSDLAMVGGWLAPPLEILAFTLLLLVATRSLRRAP